MILSHLSAWHAGEPRWKLLRTDEFLKDAPVLLRAQRHISRKGTLHLMAETIRLAWAEVRRSLGHECMPACVSACELPTLMA